VSASPKQRLLRRTDHVLRADPTRVVSKVFLPGQEIAASGRSRSDGVLERVLALPEETVRELLGATLESFGPRHRDLATTLDARFSLVAHRVLDPEALSSERRWLIGAYFSQEYAVEAVPLFNPSMVAHPDQSDLPPGAQRFVMTVRAVGEGHTSSIEFRTGTYSKDAFAQQHAELGGDQSSARFVLAALPSSFQRAELDRALGRLRGQRLTRGSAATTSDRFDWMAACNYTITFPADSALAERVIIPTGPSESHGLEDVRLVRFTAADGTVDYRGTYTAFDGVRVVPQLLRTDDFRTFPISQLTGPAAKDKGLALFPRPVGGVHLAVSRWDRENISLATSRDGLHWDVAVPLQTPGGPWEIVQLGNCGPPLETPSGSIPST